MQTELSKRGHDVLVIAPKLRGRPEQIADFIRLLGTATDIRSPFHTTAQISVSVDSREVYALLQNEQFDVLHFHEPWVPLLSRQLLLRSKSKNIATFHAKLPDTVMSRTIERVITPYTRSVLKYFDVLTAVSEPAADYVRSIGNQAVQIIPNGIDLQKYGRINSTTPSGEYVLYIGRLERRKGLKFLLTAMKVLQSSRPQTRLIIAGDGPDREQLEQFAEELGVQVEFLGRVDESTKLQLLHGARVFCSPARFGESFGIVLLEAMAAGVPVVAGDNPGYVTVMSSTGRLSLIDPQNTPEFCRKLDLMLSDDGIRSIWKKWAQKTIKQYDYKLIVDQYEKLYNL